MSFEAMAEWLGITKGEEQVQKNMLRAFLYPRLGAKADALLVMVEL